MLAFGAWEAMGRRGKERGGGGESVLVLTHDGDSPWLPESKPEGAAVKLHGFCSLASRAVIGGSDPCVLPATTGGGSGLVSVRRQGMQEDGRPGCLLGTTEEAHGESRAGEGAGVGARGGLGGRSAPWRWRWVGSACRRKGRSTAAEGRAGDAGAAERTAPAVQEERGSSPGGLGPAMPGEVAEGVWPRDL